MAKDATNARKGESCAPTTTTTATSPLATQGTPATNTGDESDKRVDPAEKLPIELFYKIVADNLTPDELFPLFAVSRNWRKLCSDYYLVRPLLNNDPETHWLIPLLTDSETDSETTLETPCEKYLRIIAYHSLVKDQRIYNFHTDPKNPLYHDADTIAAEQMTVVFSNEGLKSLIGFLHTAPRRNENYEIQKALLGSHLDECSALLNFPFQNAEDPQTELYDHFLKQLLRTAVVYNYPPLVDLFRIIIKPEREHLLNENFVTELPACFYDDGETLKTKSLFPLQYALIMGYTHLFDSLLAAGADLFEGLRHTLAVRDETTALRLLNEYTERYTPSQLKFTLLQAAYLSLPKVMSELFNRRVDLQETIDPEMLAQGIIEIYDVHYKQVDHNKELRDKLLQSTITCPQAQFTDHLFRFTALSKSLTCLTLLFDARTKYPHFNSNFGDDYSIISDPFLHSLIDYPQLNDRNSEEDSFAFFNYFLEKLSKSSQLTPKQLELAICVCAAGGKTTILTDLLLPHLNEKRSAAINQSDKTNSDFLLNIVCNGSLLLPFTINDPALHFTPFELALINGQLELSELLLRPAVESSINWVQTNPEANNVLTLGYYCGTQEIRKFLRDIASRCPDSPVGIKMNENPTANDLKVAISVLINNNFPIERIKDLIFNLPEHNTDFFAIMLESMGQQSLPKRSRSGETTTPRNKALNRFLAALDIHRGYKKILSRDFLNQQSLLSISDDWVPLLADGIRIPVSNYSLFSFPYSSYKTTNLNEQSLWLERELHIMPRWLYYDERMGTNNFNYFWYNANDAIPINRLLRSLLLKYPINESITNLPKDHPQAILQKVMFLMVCTMHHKYSAEIRHWFREAINELSEIPLPHKTANLIIATACVAFTISAIVLAITLPFGMLAASAVVGLRIGLSLAAVLFSAGAANAALPITRWRAQYHLSKLFTRLPERIKTDENCDEHRDETDGHDHDYDCNIGTEILEIQNKYFA